LSRRPVSLLKRLQWQAEACAHALVEAVVGRLPASLAFRLGEVLGLAAWHWFPKRRAIVIRNLRIAMAGRISKDDIYIAARRNFSLTGAHLISAARTARLPAHRVHEVLHVEHPELIGEALAEGRGVVLVLAHMGNWELLSRIAHVLPPGTKTGAFYRPLNNPIMDRRVLARREADGARLFSKRDPFHQVTGFLRSGGVVGVLADQRVGMQGAVVPFFGRLTRMSPLPSLLARRAHAAVMALSLVAERPGRWKAVLTRIEDPIDTASCVAAMEQAMKSGIDDVFWLQDRWKVSVGSARPISRWLGHEARGGTPHRALIWLTHSSASPLPEGWWHPDVVYEIVLASSQSAPGWLPTDARVHSAPADTHAHSVARWLQRIDAEGPLPVDYLVAPNAPKWLTDAVRLAGIRFADPR
jgi:KDO2-lipid IV(A) lauroyltransferase